MISRSESFLTAYRSSNFAPAFLFLSGGRKRALQAIYSFCREVDDVVDLADRAGHPHVPAEAEQQIQSVLNAWKKLLVDPSDVLAAEKVKGKVWAALAETMEDYQIEPRHLLDLLDGVARDLTQRRYKTFGELKTYCYGVASAVGLACLPIFGLNETRHRDFAVNLGIAVQLTNILRDLAQDAALDRIYLPQEDLKRFGYSEDDLVHSVYNDNFIRLMRFETARAREYYALAACALPDADRSAARPALLMSRLYHALLSEIERRDFRVFSGRVRLSPWRKLRCVVDGLLRG